METVVTNGKTASYQNAGVCRRVWARHIDKITPRVRARARDSDLGAFHIKLRASLSTGTVQRDELDAEEVVAGGYAGGHGEIVPAGAGNHIVHRPLPTRKALVRNLEPLEPARPCGRRVVDLCEIVGDRSLVALRDRVVRVACALRTS